MSQFRTSDIQRLLLAGQYADAEVYLRSCVEPEISRHCMAKIHLYKNQYSQALSILNEIYLLNPQNLLVLSDMCLCLYQLGFLGELDDKVLEFKKLLVEHPSSSSLDQIFDSSLLVSKILEEMADFKSSQVILSYLESQKLNSWQLQSVLIQNLRQAVELSRNKEMNELFQKLSFGQSGDTAYEIEKEHALFLASIDIFSVDDAMERFEALLRQSLSQADRSYLVSEVLEKMILKKEFSFIKSFDLEPLEKSKSVYEQAQFQILMDYRNNLSKPSVSFVKLEKTVPRLSYIRLLRQCLYLFSNFKVNSNLQERFTYTIKFVVDKDLRDSLVKSVSNLQADARLKINLNLKVLTLADKELRISHKLFWSTIDLLHGRKKISIEEFVKFFYQEELNRQHYDRLRIAFLRLNKTLKEEFLIEDIFKINKNFVWIESDRIDFL